MDLMFKYFIFDMFLKDVQSLNTNYVIRLFHSKGIESINIVLIFIYV